jgi:ankyrin repeat protein
MKKMLKKILLILFLVFSSNLVAEEVPFLLTAAAKGDLETVKAIIESGGSANTEDKDKLTALMYAVRKDNIEVVKYLIKHGAKVNAIENEGWSALMFAAKKGYIKSAEILLKNGADPKIIDPDGWSAYGLAATSGYAKMIDLLIQKGGIDPNTRNNAGATVLMLACKNGDENTIKTLLKNKANSELKDRYGKTALMYAAVNGLLFYGQLRKISWM